MKKICIVASGGDAPGMNACVKSVYVHAKKMGFQVWGAKNGYDGLIGKEPVLLEDSMLHYVSGLSGCFLGCGRSAAFRTPEGTQAVADTLMRMGFSALVVLAGNGSTRGATRLWQTTGFPVIVIPATIDNDVPFSKHSLGFSSAIEECIRHIDNLKGTMHAKGRDHIVQLMGWGSTAIADTVGQAAFADIIDTVENRHTPEQIVAKFAELQSKGSRSNLMIMQERVDPNRKTADVINETIEAARFLQQIHKIAGCEDIRMTTLGHLQRGAPPSCRDRWLAFHYGKLAVDCVKKSKGGVAITLAGGKFRVVNLEEQ